MTYTIVLNDGKYTVIRPLGHGGLKFLRYGKSWPAAEDLRFSIVVNAMFDRIEELECGLKAVLDGTLDRQGNRQADSLIGLFEYHSGTSRPARASPAVVEWEQRLRSLLEKK